MAYAFPYRDEPLFYWEREKKGSMAEVDFVLELDQQLLPLEVKAGTTGTLKSLRLFLNEKQQPFGLRICQQPLSFHDGVLTLPFYLISQWQRLARSMNLSIKSNRPSLHSFLSCCAGQKNGLVDNNGQFFCQLNRSENSTNLSF